MMPLLLLLDDRPVVDVRVSKLVRSADDLVDRHRVPADAVGEPGRVRHLVERVDVDGADIDA